MSPDSWRLLTWYCLVAFCGAVVGTVLMLMPVHGVELSVVGSSIGQGFHCLNFSGNVSASIIQGTNNSSWQITASGAI